MRIALTLRQLEIFLAVARDGQVTRAAQTLHLTQSAASMAVAQLESLLDTELFEREGRTLKLTERGRLLLAEAPELLARVEALPELLGGQGKILRGELRVAASTTVGRYLVAPAIAAFAAAHPASSTHLVVVNTELAAAAVLAHRADVAYVEGAVTRPGLIAERWRTDELVIVGSARHWKGKPVRLPKTGLPKLGWVMREHGSGTREVFERALRAAQLPSARELLTFDDSEAILQVVASGIGVACLSGLVVADGLRGRRLVALQAPYLKLSRELWRVTRIASRPGPLQAAFHSFLDRAG